LRRPTTGALKCWTEGLGLTRLNSVDCNIVDPYQELEEYCLARLGKPKGKEGKISSSRFSFFTVDKMTQRGENQFGLMRRSLFNS